MSTLIQGTKNCEQCGGEMTKPPGLAPSRWALRRFCNRECARDAERDAAMARRMDSLGQVKFCGFCGERLTRRLEEAAKHWRARKFCNRGCVGAWSARRINGGDVGVMVMIHAAGSVEVEPDPSCDHCGGPMVADWCGHCGGLRLGRWATRGLCRGQDPQEWENGTQVAVETCQACPVQRACRRYAERLGNASGMWAGVLFIDGQAIEVAAA